MPTKSQIRQKTIPDSDKENNQLNLNKRQEDGVKKLTDEEVLSELSGYFLPKKN